MEIDKKTLLEFMVKANRHTYAAPKEVRKKHRLETPFLPGHKCYYFKDGDWEYYDGYAGEEQAPGREVVFFKGRPVWAMGYQGKSNKNFSEEFFQNEVFPFLRMALMATPDDMPFRGPPKFTAGDFEYVFKMNGNYAYFTGRESISHRGIEVFFQDVMGELIR